MKNFIFCAVYGVVKGKNLINLRINRIFKEILL